MARPKLDLWERLARHVHFDTTADKLRRRFLEGDSPEHWLWTGYLQPRTRTMVTFRDRDGIVRCKSQAPRPIMRMGSSRTHPVRAILEHELTYGRPLEPGANLRLRCAECACINPHHYEVVKAGFDDWWSQGRSSKVPAIDGSVPPESTTDRLELREFLAEDGLLVKTSAEIYDHYGGTLSLEDINAALTIQVKRGAAAGPFHSGPM